MYAGISASGEEIWRSVAEGERGHQEWTLIDPKVRIRSYESDELSWDFPCSHQSMLVPTLLVTTTGSKVRPLVTARMRKRKVLLLETLIRGLMKCVFHNTRKEKLLC